MKKILLLSFFSLVFISCFSQGNESKVERNAPKIKIFPNPASNVINVLGLINSERASISISDMYGTEVLRHQWEIRKNALNIPVADLEKGIYIITINSKEQNVEVRFYKN